MESFFAAALLATGCSVDSPVGPTGDRHRAPEVFSAAAGSRTYRFILGTDFLAAIDPHCDPVVSTAAENGDRLILRGAGFFSTNPGGGEAGGEGTFVHVDALGNEVAHGTWTATRLLGFQSYGNGTPQGAPPDWYGGRANLRVHLSSGFDGVMQVDCLLGRPPAGAVEGIRLAVPGVLNFNREVGGCTVFILVD
jgi:hypothetical protein